jgi:hypothetical protein
MFVQSGIRGGTIVRSRIGLIGVVLAIACLLAFCADAARTQETDAAAQESQANKLFEEKSYEDARAIYARIAEAEPGTPRGWKAGQRVIVCLLRLGRFDDAVAAAEAGVARTKTKAAEARARRLAGNLYMSVPHWGTRSGGVFRRNVWDQGLQVESSRHDKRKAIEHLSRARLLYAEVDADPAAKAALPESERKTWREERIECLFDLAGTASRFGPYENDYTYGWGGAERDDEAAETAGADDFQEYHSRWELQRHRPLGLRLGPDGAPLFARAPGSFEKARDDDERILALWDEVRALDESKERRYTALAVYRQAMLARARFGMDRLQAYASYWWDGAGTPLQKELETQRPWELGEHEALVLAGGRIARVTLPAAWDVLGLLRRVESEHLASGIGADARYAIGVYLQSRQQYEAAIAAYETLKEAHPKSEWVPHAERHIAQIRAPEAAIEQTGIQLPGEPARLEVKHRNVDRVFFVARRIDAPGFMREIREGPFDSEKGLPHFWSLQQWHQYFVHDHDDPVRTIAARHVGEEIARWSEPVPMDPARLYGRTAVRAPISEPGAYLVFAYVNEPPRKDARKRGRAVIGLGQSRAVIAMTDLAFVEKKAEKGNLYFVCDARGGAPVAGAKLSLLEVWSEWDSKDQKSIYHKEMHELTTDAQGIALLPYPSRQRGQLHLLASAPGLDGATRIAWSGMTYWGYYSPSEIRSGQFAYCVTDRPVYRPAQTVRFKVWLREMHEGNYQNQPGRPVHVQVYDPRGNKVHEASGASDEMGGFDAQWTIGEEPPLGMYSIYVNGAHIVGGNQFRIEEYKKPEMEVSVEPGKTHAKLGEKVSATIRARYVFGAPVTQAMVEFKVYREEYAHAYWFPGEWDWLYGPGYGWTWYACDWFPWWGRVRCCWFPPAWWWGGYGITPPTPVRELVKEGEAPIGKDGTLSVEIDTAAAARDHGDKDHRYVVEAEVRDASRRVVSGEGAVKVTRQAYYAFIQADRGYAVPGEQVTVRLRCLTAENEPVEADGVMTVSEVVYGGPDNARIEETEKERFAARTDAQGLFEWKARPEKSGLYKIRFEAPDRWGGTVEGISLLWVCGGDFDGALYRFNDLEVMTDKRTYRPGEVAHVLVSTRRAGSHVLWSDSVDSSCLLSWRVISIPGKSKTIDVQIGKERRPNFWIEATTVADMRVHTQTRQVCVPPEEGLVDVAVATDRPEYLPGETVRVTVTARAKDGAPAAAQVALSAFDRSVLYIQPEMTPPVAGFFHGRVRSHTAQLATNVLEQLAAASSLVHPYLALYPPPPAWSGAWGPGIGDYRTVDDGVLLDLSGERIAFGKDAWDRAELRGGVLGRLEDRPSRLGATRDAEAASAREEDSATRALAQPAPASDLAPASGYANLPHAVAGGTTGGGGGGAALVEPALRKHFADTAAFFPALATDASGKAEASFRAPDNLTTWKINAWAVTKETRVGQASTSAVTTKNLLVRLQAPRFFMEQDEVVVTANVHNYLKSEKTARVSLEAAPAALLMLLGDTPALREVKVAAGGEARVDWRFRVLSEGEAALTVKALTDEESDAMQMRFPVLVHGMTKQVATTASIRPGGGEESSIGIELEVPEKRRPDLTRLEVQYAPSMIGAMLDAVPYCLYYPYGCTEQTMSRFLPAVLTRKTLRSLGLKLEDLKDVRGRMAEVRRIEKDRHYSFYSDSPVFDDEALTKIIDTSLSRIANMQQGDGGWGWWASDRSDPYLTSYVLFALASAKEADVAVSESMIQRGAAWLRQWEQNEMQRKEWSTHAQRAYTAYALSLAKQRAAITPSSGDARPGDLVDRLYQDRDKLNLYGKALLSLALANLGDEERARVLLRNILQHKEVSEETESARFKVDPGWWWCWWNGAVETNAWCLRALVRLEPKSDLAPKVAKWLLDNRRNGYYWGSTLDTTFCVAAIGEFVQASGEGDADMTLRLDLDDGKVVKEVRISKESFFTFDNRLVIEGVALGGGAHKLRITRKGKGAVYVNAYLRTFTKEDRITASGHELKLDRRFFRLEEVTHTAEVEGAAGQALEEKRLRYRRVPLADGESVASGELVQVELKVTSDNDYSFLALEDMKAAGLEPVDLRSGGELQEGFLSYRELRDEKVVFFMGGLSQGEHLLRYRLRAETPGVFHALPSVIYAMYAPELRANGDEHVVRVTD